MIISDTGFGVYQTRDGQEQPVTERFLCGDRHTWGCQDGNYAQWWDNGRRDWTMEKPGDLVKYLRPLSWTPADFLKDAEREAARAVSLHGEFSSLHEAYAVLLEEVDELWDEVRKKKENRLNIQVYNELVQIAASCIKAAYLVRREGKESA